MCHMQILPSDDTASGKSFISVRNKTGPKTEIWGISTVTLCSDEVCPF